MTTQCLQSPCESDETEINRVASLKSKKLALQELVLSLLKASVISIPLLVWDPQSRDKREQDAIRRLGTIFGAYQVKTWYDVSNVSLKI